MSKRNDKWRISAEPKYEELLARLDKYGEQRAKLAEHLKLRMEPEWNHFIEAASAIRELLAREASLANLDPVAWVIPGDDNANANGFLDAMCYQHGEFTKPLYAIPPSRVVVQEGPTEAMLKALVRYLTVHPIKAFEGIPRHAYPKNSRTGPR